MRRVVIRPLLGQVVIQIGDGKAAPDSIPHVPGGVGQVDSPRCFRGGVGSFLPGVLIMRGISGATG
jgi:hypothetical protein